METIISVDNFAKTQDNEGEHVLIRLLFIDEKLDQMLQPRKIFSHSQELVIPDGGLKREYL